METEHINIDKMQAEKVQDIEDFYSRYSRVSDYGYRGFMSVLLGDREFINQNAQLLAHLRTRFSDDPVTNLKLLFVTNTAFATEAAINLGLIQTEAFFISATYIRSLENAATENQVVELYADMLFAFSGKVTELNIKKGGTRAVNLAKDYIAYDLYHHIRLEDLAKKVGINSAYLCTIFKKETGMSINEYIHTLRIERATQLLRYSDHSCTWIAALLCYSSLSHFSATFKKYMHMTPNEYRQRYQGTT